MKKPRLGLRGSHVDDYVALLKNGGVTGTGEGCIFVVGEKTQHVDCKSLVGLLFAVLGSRAVHVDEGFVRENGH